MRVSITPRSCYILVSEEYRLTIPTTATVRIEWSISLKYEW